MKIDCTLDSLLLPALGTYSNEFGTKKLKGGLSTKECCDDTMLPFRKMRPYEVNEDSETTEIQHNAVFVVKTAGVTLTLHDSSEDFLGCEARVINVSDDAITVKGGVSGLDGDIDGIEIPAKREETFIFLSDGWHSMFSGYKNVITQEIADGAVTNSKIADGTVEAEKLAISVFNMNYPIGFIYVQYPQQTSPNEMWGTFSTWEEISYDGAFFRASGGNAAAFIEKSGVLSKQTGQNKSHEHHVSISGTTGDMSGDNTVTHPGHTIKGVNSGRSSYTGSNGEYYNYNTSGRHDASGILINLAHTHSFSVSGKTGSDGGGECRPDNYTIRVWKRTA